MPTSLAAFALFAFASCAFGCSVAPEQGQPFDASPDLSCQPRCDGRECGEDGCGGTCGECTSGQCEVASGLCAIDCFPAHTNENRAPVRGLPGPLAQGGSVCNEAGIVSMGDGQRAGLAYAGSTGLTIDGKEVTSCVIADFGRPCVLDDHIGWAYGFAPSTSTCGDPGGTQCKGSTLCGSNAGTALFVFAATTLDDPRFVEEGGACSGAPFLAGGPITGRAASADLTMVRYLLACRPFESCDADDANLEVDALLLTWRE